MNQIAREFLTRCFAPEETIALLLRRENPAWIAQRVVRLDQVLEPRYQRWLEYQNSAGANVYVAANPLHPGGRRRTKDNVASVRHLYIDIDEDGDTRLAALVASDIVPTPSTILSTSPGKYQVLWRVEAFDFDHQEQLLKQLAISFGGDLACTDRNRVLRVPGFLNWKYEPAYRVKVECPDDSVWTPADFALAPNSTVTTSFRNVIVSRKSSAKQSHSESDWAWVCDQLVRGTDPIRLTHQLASRRFDKPNPFYYAQRTVDIASARLWLIKGMPLDSVIAKLESRRRSQIPSAFCSTRAQEIAATAERMMARKRRA